MSLQVLENVAKSARHASFYLSCGSEDATPIIFVHGWPELSISWRHQLPVFGGLGLRAIAPDMRGYGRSSVYDRHDDYAQEEIVADMIELLDHLGAEKAIWVGHDWGAPVVWGVAQHHPDRCHGVANLCVPYIPDGFAPETIIPLVDRSVYPEDQFPAGQWDYQLFYAENFDTARTGFDADVDSDGEAAVPRRRSRRQGQAGGAPPTRAPTAAGSARAAAAPDLPRDESVLTEEDEHALRRRAEAQRLLRAGQLVHERRGQHRLRQREPRHGGWTTCRCCSCTPPTTTSARRSTVAPGRADARELRQPDRGASSPPATGWRRKSRARSTPRWPNGWRRSCRTCGRPGSVHTGIASSLFPARRPWD